mgnify:CR=1 FL=1
MVERTPKILIVDDDPRLRDLLRRYLGENGFNVLVSENGEAMKRLWVREHFDVLILDLMMPGEDGLAILKRLRAEKDMTPVIMLTAKSEVEDRIMGLDAGADDYLAKPFAMGELLARIRSITRRMGEFTPTKLKKGDVELDVAEQELSCTSSVRLSSKETKLLSYLMMNEGKTISTDELFRYVWSDETDMDIGIVWMYISYLREKIEAVHGNIRIAGEKNGDFRLQIISR